MTLHSQRKSNSTHWKKLRLRILSRDGRECHWCGMDATTVDHIIPVAKGGTDDLENLVAACRRCNFSKQDKMPDEFMMRRAGLFLQPDHHRHLCKLLGWDDIRECSRLVG